MSTGLIIFLVLIAALIFIVVNIYNKLVTYKNRYENSFAQIEVQLKRRYDLIPNLVETVKSYMQHERQTLEAVIAARNGAMAGLKNAAQQPGNPEAIKELSAAEATLSSAMGKLNVVMEDYPELKANENMMQLSEELTSTENKISFARQAFNDAVTTYNTFRQSFPTIIFAPMFGHSKDAELLEFADSTAIQEAPKVNF